MKTGLERAAKSWARKLTILREMATQAMQRGEALKASDIFRELSNIESRIEVIREALLKADQPQERKELSPGP
jgi:hypothetical protein